MTVFQLFYEMKLKTSKSWHFEASKDIMTKFKSQDLHIIRIKYCNASGSGFPPSGSQTFYFNRPNCAIICNTVYLRYLILTECLFLIQNLSLFLQVPFIHNLKSVYLGYLPNTLKTHQLTSCLYFLARFSAVAIFKHFVCIGPRDIISWQKTLQSICFNKEGRKNRVSG